MSWLAPSGVTVCCGNHHRPGRTGHRLPKAHEAAESDAVVKWLEPWWHVAADRPDLATAYEREMRAELGAGHPLFGVPVAAVGKHDGSDDVLFQVLDGSERIAVVHLTWSGHPEPPPWPVTELFAGMETFAELRMRPDHDEHCG